MNNKNTSKEALHDKISKFLKQGHEENLLLKEKRDVDHLLDLKHLDEKNVI